MAYIDIIVIALLGLAGFVIWTIAGGVGGRPVFKRDHPERSYCGNRRCRANNVLSAKFCARCGALLPSASATPLRKVDV